MIHELTMVLLSESMFLIVY